MSEEIIVRDERQESRNKIHLLFHLGSMRRFEMIMKKLLRMIEANTPMIPNFTPDEEKMVRDLWKLSNEIH